MNMEHLVENIIEKLNDSEIIKQSLETLNKNNPEELIKLIKPFVAKHYNDFVTDELYTDGWAEPIWCVDCNAITHFQYSGRCHVCNGEICEHHKNRYCDQCSHYSTCNKCRNKGYDLEPDDDDYILCPDCFANQ